MRNESLQGAILAAVLCLLGLADFILQVSSVGFDNLPFRQRILAPVGIVGFAYLGWLFVRTWRTGRGD